MVFAAHVTIDVATLSFLIGTIIPIAVALVTKQTARRGVKAAVNALLSIVAGVLSVYVSEAQGEIASVDAAAFVTAVGAAWITSIATHYGLLKPTGITGGAGAVQRATPQLGIGSSHQDEDLNLAALPAEPEEVPRGVVRHRNEV